tara:strand:+ start:556 stop:1659 length:1104 start_codon:yes stop_codon:yes gene_type:complete
MNLLKLKKINLLFIFIIIVLALIGTAGLYSAGDANFDLWARKHIFRFFIFLIIIFFICIIDIKIFYKYAYYLFFISLLLLVSVEIIGTLGKGAERWINIFGFSVQPSELIKINIILALAKFYNDLRFDRIGKIHNSFVPLLFIFIPATLVVLQPDLGTAVTIILLGIFIMFQSGVRIWKFFLAFTISIFSFPFFWQSIKPYQQKRILSFLNPESDPLGQGYQLIQSKIALGSGALQGKGFLAGTQSYLEYLPEKQTDFIFTLIGEEFGFIGISFILALFIILILIAYFISIKSSHIFGKILAIGVATNLFLYVVLNTAMVSGLLPVVGIPLPLISYGGTAMLSIMISFGLLLNVEINANSQNLNKNI